MSRYICHQCKDEHGTDNMVAYCASCFAAKNETIKRLEKKEQKASEVEKCSMDQVSSLIEQIWGLEYQLKAAEKVIEAANNLHKEHRCPVDNCTKQIIFTNLKAQYDAESTLRSPGTGS